MLSPSITQRAASHLHLCRKAKLFNAVNKDCAFEKEILRLGKVTSERNEFVHGVNNEIERYE